MGGRPDSSPNKKGASCLTVLELGGQLFLDFELGPLPGSCVYWHLGWNFRLGSSASQAFGLRLQLHEWLSWSFRMPAHPADLGTYQSPVWWTSFLKVMVRAGVVAQR